MENGLRIIVETDRESADGGFLETSDLRVESRGPATPSDDQGLARAHVLEPVTLSIAVASLSVLAYRIVEHWLRRNEYGVQIDARKIPAVISTIAGVPNGFVVVIQADGTSQSYNASAIDARTLTDMLSNIYKSAGAGG